jgi:hypothetical protein
MFTYTHTITKFNFNQHEINLLRQHVDYYLISLIDGLRSSNFGLNTLIKTANQIEGTHQYFLGEGKKWFIDSGGYSIIVGDVSPRDMSKFMDCYNYYLENFAENNCDHILSLDIPILLKYPQYNTIDYIKKMNYLAGEKSIKILAANHKLYDKFIFVWQFKTPKQYKIWNELYNDLFKDLKELKHFAIGGQVGLRGITGINFSPFIASVYQIFDILYEKNLNCESVLHLLGIYGLHDRYLMGILDRLVNQHYFHDRQGSVKITFDTINHLVSGLFKIRELKSIIVENEKICYDYNHNMIDKFHLLIEDENTCKAVQKDLLNIVNSSRFNDTNIIALLEVVKNQMFNKIMDSSIDHYRVVDLFIESGSYNKFKNQFIPIYLNLEKDFPYIFGNRLDKVLLNFQYLYAFHDYWISGRDPVRLNQLMNKFIKLINFPSDLKG